MSLTVFMGIMIPFLGTSLGSAMVFLLKNQMSEKIQKLLTGFAAGVMVAASFWSLLQPALESSEGIVCPSHSRLVPAAIALFLGSLLQLQWAGTW